VEMQNCLVELYVSALVYTSCSVFGIISENLEVAFYRRGGLWRLSPFIFVTKYFKYLPYWGTSGFRNLYL